MNAVEHLIEAHLDVCAQFDYGFSCDLIDEARAAALDVARYAAAAAIAKEQIASGIVWTVALSPAEKVMQAELRRLHDVLGMVGVPIPTEGLGL